MAKEIEVVKGLFGKTPIQKVDFEPFEFPDDLPGENTIEVEKVPYKQSPDRRLPVLHGHVQDGWLVPVSKQGDALAHSLDPDIVAVGPGHVETATAIMKVDNGKEELASDAKVKILRQIKRWLDDRTCETLLDVAVYRGREDSPLTRLGTLVVPESEYKASLYDLINEKFPMAYVSKTPKNAFASYLTRLYGESVFPTENQTVSTAWFTIDGVVGFHRGVNDESASVVFLRTYPEERENVFRRGLEYLRIGHYNAQIVIAFLYSLLGYTKYFFEKANVFVRFCCYVKGQTGCFKTSVTKPLCVPVDNNSSHRCIPIISTPASVEDMLVLQDGTICFDDYNTAEKSYAADAKRNFSKVLRAVGDGELRIKKNLKTNKPMPRKVRALAFLTGEEDVPLSQSSDFRMLVVNVFPGTFDPLELTNFQKDPSILNKFFTLYIEFLTVAGQQLVNYINSQFAELRSKYSDLQVARYVDMAAVLEIQAEILCRFAEYAGVGLNEFQPLLNSMVELIKQTIYLQAVETKRDTPEKMFLEGLFSNGLENIRIAKDKFSYEDTPGNFNGIRYSDKGELVVAISPDAAFKIAKAYWGNMGRCFDVSDKTIKERLARKGVIRFTPGSASRSAEYTQKINVLDGRPRMMVFVMSKVEEILKGER